MSDAVNGTVTEAQDQVGRVRSNSDGADEQTVRQKPRLKQRNSCPNMPVSPRGPLKVNSMPKPESVNETSVCLDDEAVFPTPERQRAIVQGIEGESTCTYALSKLWLKKWEEYVGIARGCTPGESEPPGIVEMDIHTEANNDYASEEAWKCYIRWYGICPSHHLDRKHLYFKDEKMFDICILSPLSGIVEHTVKKFNRFEEIGYIECQMRRIFNIQDYRRTRLWISEKGQIPRFRQLLLRFRMLNDCIHRDKMYILAIEQAIGQESWPTGEPGEPKGDLNKYDEITTGPKPDDYWTNQVSSSLNSLTASITESIRQAAEDFLQNGQTLIQERETLLDKTKKTLEVKLEETSQKQQAVEERLGEISQRDDKLRQERTKLDSDVCEFEARKKDFDDELKKMEQMHKIQETKIKLDIGGHLFTTSIHTLKHDSESMLAAMFSGRHDLKKESDGSYFIDRDGTHFRYILNFLRDGCIDAGTIPQDLVVCKELLREAKYYQLAGLVKYLEDLMKNGIK